ncbi:MAG: DedA family protein [Lautropia sp.]
MDATELLLTGLLNHGVAILAATLFLAALGVPLPATVLLMAAGAFVQQGVLQPAAAFAAALAAAISGDAGSYLIGRMASGVVPGRVRDGASWARAKALFERWGASGIVLTRFLLTPLALPVNLLAGSTRYPRLRFLAAAAAGEAVWVVLVGGAGYWFADRWEAMSRLAVDAVGVLVGLVFAIAGAIVLLRRLRPTT